jgi:hypothetical protein
LFTALKENTMLRAWTFMDFYNKPVGSGVVPLLIECNFKGSPRDAQSDSNPQANSTLILYSP